MVERGNLLLGSISFTLTKPNAPIYLFIYHHYEVVVNVVVVIDKIMLPVLVEQLSAIRPFSHRLTSPDHLATLGN